MKFKESKCDCEECVDLCEHFSCMGTPDEIQAIISSGYVFSNRLVVSSDNDPSLDFTVVKPRLEKGGCTFLKDGKCQLHEVGLKPIEGRVALHSTDNPRGLYRMLSARWNTKKGEKLINRIRIENEMAEK